MRTTTTRRARVLAALATVVSTALVPAVASAATSADRTPPSVTAVTPAKGATSIAVGARPTATFSEPIQPASVAASFTSASGAAVPFTTSYAAASNTVTFIPATVLGWSTKYTLTVKAKDVAGNQMTGAAPSWSFTTVAQPDDAPIAELVASPTSGTSPLVVHLDASGSTDVDATPIVGYSFDWGDGTGTSGEQSSPTADHTYTAVGTWTAKVTVRDSGGQVSSKTVAIAVAAPPPVDDPPFASLSATPSSGDGPLQVDLDASGSTDEQPIASYAFDFGDGSNAPAGPEAKVTHTYATPGTYTAAVTVKDRGGQSSTATTQVRVTQAPVANEPPSAVLQVTTSPNDGPYAVVADASGSTDDHNAIATFGFDYGDGTAPLTGTAATGQHTYAKAGTWTVTVTVTDTSGSASQATAQVTVVDPPPPPIDDPPTARLTVSPSSGTAPLTVTADASASTDNDATGIESYAFDWGDGSSVAPQGASTVVHGYTAAGTYTVTVTVRDTAGKTATATASVTVSAPPPPPTATTKPTSVVLTFDDGTVGQDDAAALLKRYGMKGTFYIDSARVGLPGYLSASQVSTLAGDGNEIGGHTLDHADLTTMTADDAKRQVCNDRVALHDLGFRVTSFAYPFGAYDAGVQQIVKDCGYNSARIVASLRSNPYGCASCVTANAIPPADAYAIKTNTSVRADTTLAGLQAYVTQAENDKGGLVPLVFHHVGSTGDYNEISLDLLTAFVDWLSKRPSTTSVVTMDQVIGGAVAPYVAGPPLPVALNVQNSSLEAGSGITPTCFNPTGFGTNTPTWTRDASSAHTGSFGEGLTVSSYTSGDRKLVIKQDVSGNACAPTGTPGHRYDASVWYRGSWSGSTHVNVVTYYRDAAGAWKVWATGPNVAPSSTAVQTSFTTSPLPAGATAVSFGLALVGTGQLSTDDYGMVDVS